MIRLVATIDDPELASLLKCSKNHDFVIDGVYLKVTPYKIYAVVNYTVYVFDRPTQKNTLSEIREVVNETKKLEKRYIIT